MQQYKNGITVGRVISCVLCAWGGGYNLQSILDLLVLSLVEKGNAGQGDSQQLENVKQRIVKGTDTFEDISPVFQYVDCGWNCQQCDCP